MNPPIELTAETVQALADSSKEFTSWREKAHALAQADTNLQFEIGDLLASGDEKWGRKAYDEGVVIFRQYSRATQQTFVHVSRRVPALLRNKDLSWAHHKAVARFDKPVLQRELLARAAEKGMSLSVFRKHMNEKYPPTKTQPPKSTKAILVTLTEDDLIWLRVVAFRADNCSLGKAAELILRDYRARWKEAFEGEAYAPEHPSLNEFYKKEPA